MIFKTKAQFRSFCEKGGWGDEHGFFQDTGVPFEAIRRQDITIVDRPYDRVIFTGGENDTSEERAVQ